MSEPGIYLDSGEFIPAEQIPPATEDALQMALQAVRQMAAMGYEWDGVVWKKTA